MDTSVESLGISIDETAENMLELYGTYGSNAETIIQNMEQGAAQARPEAIAGIQAATPSPAVLNDDVVNELMSDWDVVVGGAQREALAIQKSVADRIESANNATQNYLQGLSAALPLLETRLQAQVDAAAREASRRYGGGGGGSEDEDELLTREDYLFNAGLDELGAGTYALSEGTGLPQYLRDPRTGAIIAENPAWYNLTRQQQEQKAAQEAAESLEAEKASLMSMWGLDFDSPFYAEDGVHGREVLTTDLTNDAYKQVDEIFGTDFSDPDGGSAAMIGAPSYKTDDGKDIRAEAINTFERLLTVATPAYAYHAAVHTYNEMIANSAEAQYNAEWFPEEFGKQDDYFIAGLGMQLVAYQMGTGQSVNWDVFGDPRGDNVFNLKTEDGELYFPNYQEPEHSGWNDKEWLPYWETKNPALEFPDPTEMARHFTSLPSPTSGTSGPTHDPIFEKVPRTPQQDWDSFVTDPQPSMVSGPVQYGPQGYTLGDPILDAARGGMEFPVHFGFADTDPYPHSPNAERPFYHGLDVSGNIGNYIIDHTVQPVLNKPFDAFVEARGDNPGEAIRGWFSSLNPKPHIDSGASWALDDITGGVKNLWDSQPAWARWPFGSFGGEKKEDTEEALGTDDWDPFQNYPTY